MCGPNFGSMVYVRWAARGCIFHSCFLALGARMLVSRYVCIYIYIQYIYNIIYIYIHIQYVYIYTTISVGVSYFSIFLGWDLPPGTILCRECLGGVIGSGTGTTGPAAIGSHGHGSHGYVGLSEGKCCCEWLDIYISLVIAWWWMISKWSANDHLILEWTFVGLSVIVQPWGYQQTGDGQLVGPKMGPKRVSQLGPPTQIGWLMWLMLLRIYTSNSWFPGPIASTITWLFPNFLADFFGCSLQHMTKPTQMRQKHFLTQKRYWKSGF